MDNLTVAALVCVSLGVSGTGTAWAQDAARSAGTLAEVISDIDRLHPGFRSRVLDDSGAIRTYVNVYIGDDDARAKGGTGADVPDGSEVMVIPAMAGGAR